MVESDQGISISVQEQRDRSPLETNNALQPERRTDEDPENVSEQNANGLSTSSSSSFLLRAGGREPREPLLWREQRDAAAAGQRGQRQRLSWGEEVEQRSRSRSLSAAAKRRSSRSRSKSLVREVANALRWDSNPAEDAANRRRENRRKKHKGARSSRLRGSTPQEANKRKRKHPCESEASSSSFHTPASRSCSAERGGSDSGSSFSGSAPSKRPRTGYVETAAAVTTAALAATTTAASSVYQQAHAAFGFANKVGKTFTFKAYETLLMNHQIPGLTKESVARLAPVMYKFVVNWGGNGLIHIGPVSDQYVRPVCQTIMSYVSCQHVIVSPCHVARRICGVQMSYVSHVRFLDSAMSDFWTVSRRHSARTHVTVCL